jgi:hypothetical protein
MTIFTDISGQIFNRLTVVCLAGRTKDRKLRWRCRCICGAEVSVTGRDLRSGSTKSCGCLRVETTRRRGTTHGATAGNKVSPTYKSWSGMNQRCFNPKMSRWKDYGGRGITVCHRWREFANFLADMGEALPGQSIERVDNNLSYSPDNCIWADGKTQARNRRSTKFVTMCGVRRPIISICEEYGLNYKSVWERQRQINTSLTEALFDVFEKSLP